MAEHDQQLATLLVERQLITAEQAKEITQQAGRENVSVAEVIRSRSLVLPEALAQAEAEIVGVPYIDLGTITVNERAMHDVSRQAAATYRFFAFDERGKKLLVAMDAPDNFQALEAVKFIAKKRGLTPEIYLASTEALDRLLGGTAKVQAEIGGALRDFSQELEAAEVTGKEGQDLEHYIEEAPVTKVVAVIIRHAIEGNASDIHVEPTARDLRIRYRIDGKLHTSLLLPVRIHPAIISRVKILANLKIDESRLPQDGRFSSATGGRAFDFRVSTMPTVYGEKAALRILDKSEGAPSLDDLGMWGPQQEIFAKYLKSPHGIILLSGPTGAGKSTTLFTGLTMINRPEVNISTLEDPVEYEIKGVNQSQVNPDIGLTFASGLRNLLRQDPDILMVGEIRDKETAGLAVHASLTGHLVLSTIHTNDAVGTVPRLIDMGIDPFLLTATLRLLVAQRLVGRLCQDCKKEVPITDSIRSTITEALVGVDPTYLTAAGIGKIDHLYMAEGCPVCHETGSIGRLAIFEVVPVDRTLRNAINDAAEYDTLYDIARRQGILTMRQDGLIKALQGHVPYEDVVRVTSETETTIS